LKASLHLDEAERRAKFDERGACGGRVGAPEPLERSQQELGLGEFDTGDAERQLGLKPGGGASVPSRFGA
jgi:hypothetical protein